MLIKISLYKLETKTPSNPKWDDWKYLETVEIHSVSFENAAKMAFNKNQDADRVWIENYTDGEDPIYFCRDEFIDRRLIEYAS